MRSAWRIGLALLYPLATIVALLGHDHSSLSRAWESCHEHQAPRALASCEAGGVHLANHPDAPDLSGPASLCVACLFQSQTLALPPALAIDAPVVRTHLAIDPIAAPALPERSRPSGRGPPRG